MLSCHELVERVDDILARHLTWRERLSVRLHLLICRHCARYVAQYRRLMGLLPHATDCASEAEIDRVMNRLQPTEESPRERS